jgi:hypothetical protein
METKSKQSRTKNKKEKLDKRQSMTKNKKKKLEKKPK